MEPLRNTKLEARVLGLRKSVPGSREKANFDRNFALKSLDYAKLRSVFKFFVRSETKS